MRKELTQDIPGCINISDDILVYGKTQREHDESLRRVLERAKSIGITFNPEKCEFDMLTPYHDPNPFTVIGIKGSMITAAKDGEIKSRNSSHFKRLRRRHSTETFPENSILVALNDDRVSTDYTSQELQNDPTGVQEGNEEVIPQGPQETVQNRAVGR